MSTDAEGVHFDNRSSNPSSGGEAGLAGDLGISSERTGPEGADPRETAVSAAGTGSRGDAVERTDGEVDTTATEWDGVDVSQSDVHPNRPAELDEPAGPPNSGLLGDSEQNVDRTVGEPRPNPIPDEKSRR